MTATRRFDGLRHAITMFLVAASSLLLLIYIGHGEAQRNYLKFVLDSVVAQGRIVQNSMEGYLRSGLPLRQYVGFKTLARTINDSDDSISAMFVVDVDKRLVFESGGAASPSHPPATSVSRERSDTVEVRRSNGVYQVVLPLRNKFETVGGLIIEVPRTYVSTRVERSFQSLAFVAIGLSVLFAFAVSIRRATFKNRRVPWLPIAYGLTFITMSAIVVATLVALYSEGVQTKTKALAHSLAQRLSDVISFNLSIDQLDGLESVFRDYRKLNPDISGAALTVNNLVQIHTDPALVGKPWVRASATYEYKVNLSQLLTSANRVEVVVSVPTAIVYNQVLRTVKNFAALFVASAVLAWLILQLAGIFRLSQNGTSADQAAKAPTQPNLAAVELVKPIFFAAVFLEHLAYPFLPQFILETIQRSGFSDSFVSAPFMAYYLCFALALIPAGRYAERYGPRRPMVVGLMLAAIGLLGLGLANGVGSLMIARALAGIGQGMLFIGVQSYILDTESPERKTRGAAIIVIGFQAGMISGTAIGSLLVGYVGMDGIFALAGGLAIGMTVYAICLIPKTLPQTLHPTWSLSAWRSLARDLVRLLPTSEFLRTMLLIGVPTKAVMTGFVIFALPLILSRMNYAPEDIGQVIMLYAIGVLLASTYSSRLVDRIGRTEMVLFWGAAASGVSLLLVGLIDWQAISAISGGSTVVLLAGTLLLGAAHGFVLAPVVTRIADCRVAEAIGVHSVVTAYRFLERIGHVVGPIIVGQLFIFAGHSAVVATIIGAVVVLLALLYLIRPQTELSGMLHGSSSR